ncbi:MAG: helix-turn-helix transcriptional regulator [Firmicutes bacterium]|nr:helix-turn-helix transcriptional regulator [Bacillota bacterium]HOB22158.1 helix-turn-helix transcriptional regulator [Bacillota bacterium]HQD40098.1 helix-turn-helix transcriptional regulator [Bacillota bacterium]
MSFGRRLKLARKLAGFTMKDLAAKVNLSALTVSKFERELAEPTPEQLEELAEALKVRVDFFFEE